MSYVFDTNAFSQLFHSYYRNRFPTLWEQFDELIEDGEITSTREVAREIDGDRVVALRDWAVNQRGYCQVEHILSNDFNGEFCST